MQVLSNYLAMMESVSWVYRLDGLAEGITYIQLHGLRRQVGFQGRFRVKFTQHPLSTQVVIMLLFEVHTCSWLPKGGGIYHHYGCKRYTYFRYQHVRK